MQSLFSGYNSEYSKGEILDDRSEHQETEA